MTTRPARSIAGDVDYDVHGAGYAAQRRSDPRIARAIVDALGAARSIVNVVAGAGSYEPDGRDVVAVEPSNAMRAQRPPRAAPAVDAVAEALPFADAAFDAAMALVTVHQWTDPMKGLRELRRVARGPVVVMTFDPAALERFWLARYIPEMVAHERGRMPSVASIASGLGGDVTVLPVAIPSDCLDGFWEAFYARPEAFLDAAVRRSQSSWSFMSRAVVDRCLTRLSADLGSGAWDREHGALRTRPSFDDSLRLIVGRPATA